MANIVQQTQKTNHVNHSSFDLSGNINFTAAPGMLLPLRVDDCLPNSRYTFDYSLFARTVQMVVPSFARVKAHVDTFFVPYRLLGTDYQAAIVGDERGNLSNYSSGTFSVNNKSLPFFNFNDILKSTDSASTSNGQPVQLNFTLYDAAGIKNSISSMILFNSLGYGIPSYSSASSYRSQSGNNDSILSEGAIGSVTSASNINGNNILRSTMFLQAYQKIYQDFYRNKLWEKENRMSYYCPSSDMGTNLSSVLVSRGMSELRYKDFDKDRLIGMIPNENNLLSDGISQYASSILNGSLGIDSPSVLGPNSVPLTDVSSINSDGRPGSSLSSLRSLPLSNFKQNVSQAASPVASILVQQYTAISNRRLEAFQKFAEITMLNKSDYQHQIKAHFGFTPSALNSDYCTLVNSFDVPLGISDVENTNGSSSDGVSPTLGYLGGKGTISGQNREFSVSVQEHGCIMSIFYILPQIDWSNEFVDRSTMRFNRYDFAIPEFDRLGFEPVRIIDVNGEFSKVSSYNNTTALTVLGYLPRYWSYKTRLDVNTTGFSDSSGASVNFDSYVVKYDKDRFYMNFAAGTMYKAFKCPPTQLDGLFPTSWTSVPDNPFIVTFYVKCVASLPLSIDSLPY